MRLHTEHKKCGSMVEDHKVSEIGQLPMACTRGRRYQLEKVSKKSLAKRACCGAE